METFEKYGVMDKTIIVAATAADSAPLQYIAPMAGAAMGEYFVYNGEDGKPAGPENLGRHVLITYDDLLERAVKMNEEYGLGSMTALPIIETQAGDVSAYIPTNVISITDGQIYLQTDLFYQGQRPAVDVGISVSRVGGSAQTKAVKSVSGTLRLDLAAYRELKAFTQFGSDLDKSTQDQLNRGARMTELLKQGRYSTLSFEEEAVAVYAGGKGFLDDVPVSDVVRFRNELIEFLRASHADVLKKIHDDAKFTPESEAALNAAIDAFKAQFVA